MKEIYVRELKIEDSKMRNCLKFLRNNRNKHTQYYMEG